jgi:hypothetical protein
VLYDKTLVEDNVFPSMRRDSHGELSFSKQKMDFEVGDGISNKK